MIDDGREIGARLLGDLPGGRTFEAEPAEHVEGRLDQARPRIGTPVALSAPIVRRPLPFSRGRAWRRHLCLRPGEGSGGRLCP